VLSVANDLSIMYTIEGHTGAIYSLSFSPDNTRLVSGGSGGTICLWNPTAGTLLKTVYNAHKYYLKTVAHSPNGNLIASGGEDNKIKIWDTKTLDLKFAINDAHSRDVTDLSFTPKGPFLLSASYDSTVNVIKIVLLDSYVTRSPILLAYLHFSSFVNKFEETEVEKFEAAKKKLGRARGGVFAKTLLTPGGLMQCALIGGGPKGVLGVILSFL